MLRNVEEEEEEEEGLYRLQNLKYVKRTSVDHMNTSSTDRKSR